MGMVIVGDVYKHARDFWDKTVKVKLLRDLLSLDPYIDNLLFRLHYKMSFMFVWFTIFVYAKVHSSFDIISCIFPPSSDLSKNQGAIDASCFANSVYSVTFGLGDIYLNSTLLLPPRIDVLPGVMGFDGELIEQQSVRYHKYYQYTPFIMLVQMILFLTPWYLWTCLEDGKIAMLINRLDSLMDRAKFVERKKLIAEYFVASLGYNNFYGMGYVGCEMLNLICVVFQLYFLDLVTGQAFSNHGLNVFKYTVSPEMRGDPFNVGFPTVGKCTFNRHGPSGNIIPHSGICVLPLNLVSRGYFVFIWYLLLILGIADMVNLMYRLATVASTSLRFRLIRGVAVTTPTHVLKLIVKNSLYGDWFILMLMAQNLDCPVFNEILEEIGIAMQQTKSEV